MKKCGVVRTVGIAFGRPCVHGTGIPIESLACNFRGGDLVRRIAFNFELTPLQVMKALRFLMLYPKCDLPSFWKGLPDQMPPEEGMSERIGLARRIAFYLATDPMPWPTLGDIADALGQRTGTAMGERLREARGYYKFEINCIDVGEGEAKTFRYYMSAEEQSRVRKMPDFKAWRSGIAA